MFSEAKQYLDDALAQVGRTGTPLNFNAIRNLLQAALSAVESDGEQPLKLRRLASQQINQAISYTYSRTNPMGPPSMLTTPPISPFQRASGPYGFMLPSSAMVVPGLPTGDEPFSQASRERAAFRQLILAARNTVIRGLH